MKIKFLNRVIDVSYTNKSITEAPVKSISSLAPKVITEESELKNIKPYLKKLSEAIDTPDINNIALTGGYGAGKSTIIKTFQYHNTEKYNFLNISLAAFNQKQTKDNFKELFKFKVEKGKTDEEAEKEIEEKFRDTLVSNEELEKQLEISILQQIIYKVRPSDLPESRFKRIVNIPSWKLSGVIPISFILWICSIILLFKYDFLDYLNPNNWTLKFRDLHFSSVVIFLISFLGIGYFSKLIVELFSNSRINKVNLKGEIEIGDNSGKSILNEHYDEILYYFEKNKFDVLIIEDLDRFKNTNIFTKLRELNILLNNADTLKKNYKSRGIKFLYAVGDDLFEDKKERVKFFEYIIPVIPFINSSNAEEQLKTLMSESGIDEKKFPDEFLSDITTFIDDIDMRLLINIFHEFEIYKSVLLSEIVEGNEAELFAIITYKNIDPEDFNKLNKNEGKLYDLLHSKDIYIKELQTKIKNKIAAKTIAISDIENENSLSLKELRKVYIYTILSKLPKNKAIYPIDINELFEDEQFEKMISTQTLNYKWKYSNYSDESDNLTFKFSEIEAEVSDNVDYIFREKLIQDKFNDKREKLKKEINNLTQLMIRIENWSLKEVFNEVEIDKYLNHFSNNGLLRVLILEGYINENYSDYISLFHEVSFKKEDKIFQKNFKSGINIDFTYKLSNVENLASRTEERWFEREAILNFDLLDFLGRNYNTYSSKYDLIIKLLSNKKKRSLEFINSYINRIDAPLEIFIQKLFEEWDELIDYVFKESIYTIEEKELYLRLILKYNKIEVLKEHQSKETLESIISNTTNFITLISKDIDEEKFAEIFEYLSISFKKVEEVDSNDNIHLKTIYNKSAYEINKNNLYFILNLYYDGFSDEMFNQKNYSCILESGCSKLINYIESSLNDYVEKVYLKLEENRYDEEKNVVLLLNNIKIKQALRYKIIQKISIHNFDLVEIKDFDVKNQLLINHKITSNWNNVIDYYKASNEEIDENLIEYLNTEEVYNSLSNEAMAKEGLIVDNAEFRKKILLCDELILESYKSILASSLFKRDSLDFSNLNSLKVQYLLDNILNVTKANYDLLKSNYPNKHILLLEKKFSAVLANVVDFNIDDNDSILIMISTKILNLNKIKYLELGLIDENLIVENSAMAKIIGEIMLEQLNIVNFRIKTLESIILENKNRGVELINLYKEELNDDQLVGLVKILGDEYERLFINNKRPSFLNTESNKILLNELVDRELIRSVDVDRRKSSILRAFALTN